MTAAQEQAAGRTAPDGRSFVGVAHLSLYVADVESSAEWYQRVLRFEPPQFFRSIARLHHGGSGIDLVLRPLEGERAARGQVFDHVALQVTDRAELASWSVWLGEIGVDGSVEEGGLGSSIELLDPDGNEIELFLPAAPPPA